MPECLLSGEDVNEYKKWKNFGHGGAWLFGRDTQQPRADARAPKSRRQIHVETVPKSLGKGRGDFRSEAATVPAGTFSNCLKSRKSPATATRIQAYAPASAV